MTKVTFTIAQLQVMHITTSGTSLFHRDHTLWREELANGTYNWYIYRIDKWVKLFNTNSPELPSNVKEVQIDGNVVTVIYKDNSSSSSTGGNSGSTSGNTGGSSSGSNDPISTVSDNGLEGVDCLQVGLSDDNNAWIGTIGETMSDRTVKLYKDYDTTKFYKKIVVDITYTAEDNENSAQNLYGTIGFVKKDAKAIREEHVGDLSTMPRSGKEIIKDFAFGEYDGYIIGGRYIVTMEQFEDGKILETVETIDDVMVPKYNSRGTATTYVTVPYIRKEVFMHPEETSNYIYEIDFTEFHCTSKVQYQVHVWGWSQDNFVITDANAHQDITSVSSVNNKVGVVNLTAQDIYIDENSTETIAHAIENVSFDTSEFVVKETGKGLSSNNFSDLYKEAIDDIPNQLDTKQDKITDTDELAALASGITATKVAEYDAHLAGLPTGTLATTDDITAEINKLDYADAEVTDQYVTSVKEVNGVISVTRAAIPDASTLQKGVVLIDGSTIKLTSGKIAVDASKVKLTGYTKPTTTSAIAATDTIPEAIGKLEAGIEEAGKIAEIATSAAVLPINNKKVTIPDATATTVGLTKVVDTYSATGTEAISGKAISAALASLKTPTTVGGPDSIITAINETDGVVEAMAKTAVVKEATPAAANAAEYTIAGSSTKVEFPIATSTGYGSVKVDTALSSTSTNPVENKAVVANTGLVADITENAAKSDGTATGTAPATIAEAVNNLAKNGGKIDKVATPDGELTITDKKVTIPEASSTVFGAAKYDNETIAINTDKQLIVKEPFQFLGNAEATALDAADIATICAAKIPAGKVATKNMIVSIYNADNIFLGQMIYDGAAWVVFMKSTPYTVTFM